MALKARLETLDGLPEAIAKEYKEVKEGDEVHYVLDAEGIEDVSGLKSALSKERGKRSVFEKVLKRLGLKTDIKNEEDEAIKALLDRLGDDTIEEALDKAKQAAAGADEGTKAVAQVKKLEKQLREQQEASTTLSGVIDRLVRKQAIVEALAEVEGNVTLMLPHLLPMVMAVEEEGADGKDYVAKVIDPKTKEVRMKAGKEMSLKDLVEEVAAKPEYSDAFPGTGASGSGAQPSTRKGDGGGAGPRSTQPGDAVAAKKASGACSAV